MIFPKDGGLNVISIANLKELGRMGEDGAAYGDDLILTDSTQNLTPFMEPCKVNGVVLLVCLEGSVVCDINLKRQVLRAGDMIVSFASNVLQVQTAEGFKVMGAVMSNDYLNKLRLDIGSKISLYLGFKSQSNVRMPAVEVEAFQMMFRLVIKALRDKRDDCESIVDALVLALCNSIISVVRTFGSQMAGAGGKALRSEVIFEKFMNCLVDHHVEQRGVAFYANKIGLSPNYLSLTVRAFSGRSAAEWINDYTINRAKVLLRFSDLSIQQVAAKLNFGSQSAFGKYFKQYAGVSPMKFRRGVVS